MILDGKKVSKLIRERIAYQVAKIDEKIKLIVFLIGDNGASKLYVRNKERACKDVGIECKVIRLSKDLSEDELLAFIDKANKDNSVHGILVQLPLPRHINSVKVINSIDPLKDVDGLTSENQGKLFNGLTTIIPATPKGVISLIDHYKINLESINALVIGRSNLVGKPLSVLLLNRNATITTAHAKTKDLSKLTKESDLIITAVGKPNLLTKAMVKKEVVIIDVGINRLNGIVVGDVDFEEVKEVASFITPVPGGVGPMTIASLLENVLECYKLLKGIL